MINMAAKGMFLVPLETYTYEWILGGNTALHLLYSKKDQNFLEWLGNVKHLCKI